MVRVLTIVLATLLNGRIVLGEEKPAIAVLPLKAQRFPEETARVLDDLLVQALHDVGRHRVISINDISAMLDAEKLNDALGCDDIACAVEIGGALGTRYLVYGSVSLLGDKAIVNLTMTDTGEARVVNRARSTVQNDENNYLRAVDVAVRRLYQLEEEAPAPVETRGPGSEPLKVELGELGTRVIFETAPPGSVVLLDGEFLCQATPCSKFVEPGTHEVTVFVDSRCHFEKQATVEVLDQEEQTVTLAGEPRQAGIRVFLTDSAGNDLVGTVEVDGEPLGEVPGAFTVEACIEKIKVTAEDGRLWQEEVELEPGATRDVRAVLEEDAKRVVKVKRDIKVSVDTALSLETYREVMVDGESNRVAAERQLAGQVHGAISWGDLTLGTYVPYNSTLEGSLPDGVGDASVYLRAYDADFGMTGWVRMATADEGLSTAQDARLGLTEAGFKLQTGDEFHLGFGMTYARKVSGANEGYDRWSILLDTRVEAADFLRVYGSVLVPLGDDQLNIVFDREGTYFDLGTRVHWRFRLLDWLAVSPTLDLRFSGGFPPDPPESSSLPETPSRLALTVIPGVTAHLFRLGYVRVRLARFRRFGVPWASQQFEGFAIYQSNGAKVAPMPVLFEIGARFP